MAIKDNVYDSPRHPIDWGKVISFELTMDFHQDGADRIRRALEVFLAATEDARDGCNLSFTVDDDAH